MLVPERGEPTTKIGLFILLCIPFAQSGLRGAVAPRNDKFYTSVRGLHPPWGIVKNTAGTFARRSSDRGIVAHIVLEC
jgi:hypothetical protein